jgi:tetratricopeptide (TPR) repeat protein
VAAAADKKYIAATKVQGVYPMMYYSHNLHFLAFAATMRGDFPQAKKAADGLVANILPHKAMISTMPMLEGFLATPYLVLHGFEKWNEILKLPSPDVAFANTNAVWRFVRGVAYSKLGQTDAAEKEQLAWKEIVVKISPDTVYDELNKTGAVFKVHENLLKAAVAGSKHEEKTAIDFLAQAVTAEDALNYSEPPPWFPHVRPMLGRALLENKQLAEAEKIFRADLEKNPRNGRSLAGLRDCLKEQNRQYEADQVDRQFRAAWKVADAKR